MDFIPTDPTVPQEADPLNVMLDIAGFTNAQANRIRADGFDSIDDMGIDVLEEQDIKDLASTFSRMPATSRISFGIARTKRLIGMMHWVQDHERVSLTASIAVGIGQPEMRDAWSKALERANSRSAVAKQAKATQAGADPGELKSDKGFYDWDDKWENYLSTIPGQNGVPLSYVVRVDSTPEYQPETPYVSFIDKSIGCAPHSGAAYISDKRKVHQLLISHLSTVMQQWIEPVQKIQDGRVSYEALKNHCLGTGNVSRRVAHAEQMKKNLCYTDERRGNFNQFLQKLSKMFLIFKDEKEPMAEEAKIRMLFEKINHPELKQAIAALEVQHDMNKMTYVQITNHLATKVSKFDTKQVKFRGVGATKSGKPKQEGKAPKNGGVHMPDGSVFTGFYPNWRELSEEKQNKVKATREKKKLAKKSSSKVSEIKTLIKEVASLKRTIAQTDTSTEETEEGKEEDSVPNDAGTQFGGRTQKAKKA